jgi:hypothetical protein
MNHYGFFGCSDSMQQGRGRNVTQHNHVKWWALRKLVKSQTTGILSSGQHLSLVTAMKHGCHRIGIAFEINNHADIISSDGSLVESAVTRVWGFFGD